MLAQFVKSILEHLVGEGYRVKESSGGRMIELERHDPETLADVCALRIEVSDVQFKVHGHSQGFYVGDADFPVPFLKFLKDQGIFVAADYLRSLDLSESQVRELSP